MNPIPFLSQYTNIPDSNFENYLIVYDNENFYGKNTHHYTMKVDR